MQSFSGAALREARNASGLTQRQLGEIIGTTEQHVQLWEYGKRQPTATYLLRMMVALHCTVENLLMDDPK